MSTLFLLPAYVGIILTQGSSVYLIQRANTDWRSGYWNFPGGLVEHGETLMQAAIRETKEEIGVTISPENFKLVHVIHVKKSATNTKEIIGFYFMTSSWDGTPHNNELNKITNAQWFDITNLPEKITDHALLALSGIKKEVFYSEHP